MKYSYKTKRTCSSKISFDLDDDIVSSIVFTNGCEGNLQTIQRLLDGCTVEQIEEKCGGIQCGMRGTSCADQLSVAVRKAYNKSLKGEAI
ncbi:MAG: TIGR03905 family TSCPD domain-containing protein [Oscillospiraceae bacterium]|jgi:uncharacterized protein (TIGR03905 family)|nr:TIGR03905 family TSCPD domain-containing protein [Oscillospiraceae bacterium]